MHRDEKDGVVSAESLPVRVEALVCAAVRELSDTYELDMEVTPDTVLFGEDSPLDSTDLVSVIIDIEARLADDLGLDVVLADEKAMSQERSPFRDVPSLVAYILDNVE